MCFKGIFVNITKQTGIFLKVYLYIYKIFSLIFNILYSEVNANQNFGKQYSGILVREEENLTGLISGRKLHHEIALTFIGDREKNEYTWK